MSADSMSSVASGPVPTTPTELISIEMNRFDNAWVRLDENIKAPVTTEEVDPLWKQVAVKPTHIPGQPQTHFLQMNGKANLVLQSPMHIATLHRAIALARQLIFCDIGRVLANEKGDEASVAKVDEYSRSHPWTLQLEYAPATGRLVRWNQKTPDKVYLNMEVVDKAAKAGLVMQALPSDDNVMIYKRHIMMLGVILGRSLFESLLDVIQDQSDPKTRLGTRRGWIDWENLVVGGHIVGCGSPAFQGFPSSLDRLAIQRKREMGSMEMPSYFTLSDEVVSALVDQAHNWESLLPLRPTGGWTKGAPADSHYKLLNLGRIREGRTIDFQCGFLTRLTTP